MVGRKMLVAWLFLLVFATGAATPREVSQRPIDLEVDASEVTRRIIHVRVVIPTSPGPLTLLYPKWIPGEHGPTGPISDLTGLKINARGKAVAWHRDPVDMYAIHCEVPEGARTVEVSFDCLAAPPGAGGGTAGPSITHQMAALNWHYLLLYPKGRSAREIMFQVRLTLPKGWRFGTALPVESRSSSRPRFAPVSLETLIDSPLLCGRYFREIPIGPKEGPPHFLEIACDSEEGLEPTSATKASCDRLVAEAKALLGSPPYDSYRFLLPCSNFISQFGLEHLQCSENRLSERSLVSDSRRVGGLLSHEFVHAWNGKYRRPAGMVVEDFQEPLQTELLWVYEGLTTYLGMVLSARSGFGTPEQFRERLASIAEWSENRSGRSWRSLEDTAAASQLSSRGRSDWPAWRRGRDYYDEGALIWLEVDTIIRQETQGRHSLDDFCRRFFARRDGSATVVPFTFDEVVAELNAVATYDWRALLTRRATAVAPEPPLDGIKRSGWRLSYEETSSDTKKASDKRPVNLSASIGATVAADGTIVDLMPGKAADRAGLAPGMKVAAVNSRRFSVDRLQRAVAATKGGKQPLELLVENGDFFATYRLDYREGAKYSPRLERDPSKDDLLSDILKPLASEELESKPPDSKK